MLAMERIEGLIMAKDWQQLAEIAHGWLETNQRLPERQDGLQDFLLYLMEKGEKFWPVALAKCTTIMAMKRYAAASFHRRRSHLACPSIGESLWIRRRTRELLFEDRNGRFRREIWEKTPVYGLITWQEGPKVRGTYRGSWREDQEMIKYLESFRPFPRRPTSERRGPYSDEDIEAGCIRLLNACSRYTSPKQLVLGMKEYKWCMVIDLKEISLNEPVFTELLETDHTVIFHDDVRWYLENILKKLSSRQKRVLVEYVLPHQLRGPDQPTPTLGEIAAPLGVSHQTVKNEADRALKAFQNDLQEMDDVERLAILRNLMELFEKGDLGRLIEGKSERPLSVQSERHE